MRFEGIPAGSVNSNYCVETDRGRYFLRLYEQVGAAEVETELRLVTHLRRGGVPTPGVIARRDGALLGALAGKPAALFELSGGRELCHREVTTEHARTLGESLARLHGAARGFSGLGAGRFAFPRIVERLAEIESAGDAEAGAVLPVLRDEAAWLAARAPAGPGGVIHGDLFRDNVRWEARGAGDRIVAIIDFESACEGALLYDLATCLLSWTYDDDFRADLGRAMVAGYGGADAGALWVEARRAAFRFTVTRILDFHLRRAAGPRKEKDFRRYLARLLRLRALGPDGAARLWGLV